jgi:hypothetical protein
VAVAVTTTFGYSGRLWRVLWEHGYKEVFWCLAVDQWCQDGWDMSTLLSGPCPCGVVCPRGLRMIAVACISEVLVAQTVHN